jgi:hypothetical protein
MKVCYRALLDVYCEMDQKVGEERSYRVRYAREAVSTPHIQIYKIFFRTLSKIVTPRKKK